MPKYFQLDFRLMKIVLYIFFIFCGVYFQARENAHEIITCKRFYSFRLKQLKFC